jgi:hypothetical protein
MQGVDGGSGENEGDGREDGTYKQVQVTGRARAGKYKRR